MECSKCHFFYKEEDTKKFTCSHIICKPCFFNVIIKDLINNINITTKTYSINCKCNKGTISFSYDEIKNITLPKNLEEKTTCSIHNNEIFHFYDKTNKKLLCNKCNENQEFKDLPYEIINLQKINYNCPIEPLLNKCVRTVTFSSLKIYENEVKSLKKLIGNSINDIQTMKLSLIQKYKKLINNELENYDILVMRKKMMKEGSNK